MNTIKCPFCGEILKKGNNHHKCEEKIISCKNKVFNQEVKIAIPIYIFEFWILIGVNCCFTN